MHDSLLLRGICLLLFAYLHSSRSKVRLGSNSTAVCNPNGWFHAFSKTCYAMLRRSVLYENKQRRCERAKILAGNMLGCGYAGRNMCYRALAVALAEACRWRRTSGAVPKNRCVLQWETETIRLARRCKIETDDVVASLKRHAFERVQLKEIMMLSMRGWQHVLARFRRSSLVGGS
jgi:hypothetical protein